MNTEYTQVGEDKKQDRRLKRSDGQDNFNIKRRTRFTDEQLLDFESLFEKYNYPKKSNLIKLAAYHGISYKTVKIWFQNRRARQKKDLKEGKSVDHIAEPRYSIQNERNTEYEKQLQYDYDRKSYQSPQGSQFYNTPYTGAPEPQYDNLYKGYNPNYRGYGQQDPKYWNIYSQKGDVERDRIERERIERERIERERIERDRNERDGKFMKKR